MNLEGITPEIVQQMQEAVLAIAPEMGEVIESIRSKAKDEQEAAALLWQWCEDNPAIVERMTAGFLNPQTALVIPEVAANAPTVSSPLPAMLAPERAQFDGDVPEFRKGPLRGNMRPAIPVQTTARSAVQIGMELEQAANVVQKEAQRLLADWQSQVEGSTGTDMVISDEAPEPESYHSGKTAEMATVTETPSTLMLSDADRQKYAWQMISTTQGRRSALSQVASLVEESLKEAGLVVTARDFVASRTVNVLAHAAWRYDLSGRAELQPQVSFVDVAAQSIAEALIAKGAQGWLEAVPIDTVDIRKVGWACRIVEDQ